MPHLDFPTLAPHASQTTSYCDPVPDSDELQFIKKINNERIYQVMSKYDDQIYALKAYPYIKGSPDLRFMREKECKDLSHPHIVKILDAILNFSIREGHKML